MPIGISDTLPSFWRPFLQRYGLLRIVLALTLIAIALSVLITLALNALLGDGDMEEGWVISILAPAIITPLLATPVLRLVDRLDRAEKRLRTLSTVDELTSTFNRRYVLDFGEQEIRRTRRKRGALSVALMDFDKFKLINDRHGHQFGDAVLAEVARACRATLRQSDVVARYGGDEFMFVFPNADRDSARRLAQRILRSVAALRLRHGRAPVRPRVSIGLATWGGTIRTLDDLLSHADAALYRAKRAGGRRYAQA